MATTPINHRSLANGGGLGLKLTPSTSTSPFLRSTRSPNKARGALYESGLSLKRIIGTTVSSPTAFDSLSSSPVFAYTAGAAAIVVNLVAEEKDKETVEGTPKYSQRFFRARPTAVPVNLTNISTGAPATPLANRSTTRDAAPPYSPATPYTSQDWGESPSGRTWTSRERIKAATCLSLSRDGRFLAVGETGYCPRVLIYSLLDNSSDTPLVILNEHTFGVRAVAFSPNNKYLASLGSPNDGFLYVWSINQRTGAARLHSSNKCTSSVKQMIWLGNSIITVGTRHIKVWRVENDRDSRSLSPSKPRFALDPLPVPRNAILKALSGRNVLLGPLVETTFTAVAAISDEKAVVCSEKGDICLLDDSEGQRLIKLANAGFWVTCLAVDSEFRRIRIGGKNGQVKVLSLDELLAPSTPPESPVSFMESTLIYEVPNFCAMGYSAGNLITIDSKHSIEISSVEGQNTECPPRNVPFQAHGDAVLGVRLLSQPNEKDAAFMTWSANGTVVFWDLEGESKGMVKVDIDPSPGHEDDSANQCLVVRPSNGAAFLATGDRLGVLRIITSATQACEFHTRAHMSDIQDIAVFEHKDLMLIATCGRDRTIQLFRKVLEQWDLIQTLEDHSASVTGIFFAEHGEKLISCSTDRTIHIRQLVKHCVDGQDVLGAVPVRIITLKSSPLSMVACQDEPMCNFVVSLLDRTVATYEICSGRLVSSFKATADSDGNDAVSLDTLRIGLPSSTNIRPTILAGVSGTDKSVRVYDATTGAFLDREWGHTAAVTDVALLEPLDSDQKTLISTGSDGTIMIWNLSPRPLEDASDFSRESSPPKEITSVRLPLRRVLSRAELAEFQRASPVSTPTGRSSPPRTVRRKTSRYGLSAQSPTIPPLPTNARHFTTNSDDSSSTRKGSPRNISRSPPPSPRIRESKRPSLAESRGRTKSTGNFKDIGTLNVATEQACRTLRAYRKKLNSSESVKDDLLKELDQELRLTAVALGEKSVKTKALSDEAELMLRGLVDSYSERLVSLFDEKLRLGLEPKSLSSETQRPKTAGNSL